MGFWAKLFGKKDTESNVNDSQPQHEENKPRNTLSQEQHDEVKAAATKYANDYIARRDNERDTTFSEYNGIAFSEDGRIKIKSANKSTLQNKYTLAELQKAFVISWFDKHGNNSNEISINEVNQIPADSFHYLFTTGEFNVNKIQWEKIPKMFLKLKTAKENIASHSIDKSSDAPTKVVNKNENINVGNSFNQNANIYQPVKEDLTKNTNGFTKVSGIIPWSRGKIQVYRNGQPFYTRLSGNNLDFNIYESARANGATSYVLSNSNNVVPKNEQSMLFPVKSRYEAYVIAAWFMELLNPKSELYRIIKNETFKRYGKHNDEYLKDLIINSDGYNKSSLKRKNGRVEDRFNPNKIFSIDNMDWNKIYNDLLNTHKRIGNK